MQSGPKKLNQLAAMYEKDMKKSPLKPSKKNPDPDMDGDDDTTPQGDTDHDFQPEVSAPKSVPPKPKKPSKLMK